MRVDTRRVKNFLLDLAFKIKKQMIKKLKLIEKKVCGEDTNHKSNVSKKKFLIKKKKKIINNGNVQFPYLP